MMPRRGEGDVLDGFTVTTALLASTERIGVGSIRLAHHWNAAKLAQAVATQERLFPGRVRFLISVGAQSIDRRFGLPWAGDRAARLDETLQALRALWRGEHVTTDGTFVTLDDAWVRPAPPAGRPAIEVGCGMSSLLDVVVRHADCWDLNVPPTPARVRVAMDALVQVCERQERDAATIATQSWVLTRPQGDPKEADLVAAFRRWHPWFDHLTDAQAAKAVVAGSPDACLAQFDALRVSGLQLPLADLTGLSRDAAHQAIDALSPKTA